MLHKDRVLVVRITDRLCISEISGKGGVERRWGRAVSDSLHAMVRCSVIIPCYNQGHFLAKAIESALGQTHADVEVIVVNDGATDSTAAVAASFRSAIKYVEQSNAGLSAARNTGIANASGEFVLFLDADDYLGPGMLEAVLRVARERPDASVFYGGYEFVDVEGKRLAVHAPPTLGMAPLYELLRHNPMPCHSVLVRRAALDCLGRFDTSLRACEDWDLWLRMAAAGCIFVAVSQASVMYRRYSDSMSTDQDRMWLATRAVLQRHWQRQPSDPRAARAAADGLRQARERWLHGGLWPQVRRLVAERDWKSLTMRLTFLAGSDPAVVGRLAWIAAERVCYRMIVRRKQASCV
jgi:glycosyltransferase involved in cell wall biosynthesis